MVQFFRAWWRGRCFYEKKGRGRVRHGIGGQKCGYEMPHFVCVRFLCSRKSWICARFLRSPFFPLFFSAAKENLPWVEKYRPNSLDDLISHEDIIRTSNVPCLFSLPCLVLSRLTTPFFFHCAVNNLIEKNKLPHLLLYGPPGTGKTSTILACARKLHGPKFGSMILELNASDARGIDVVRNQIKSFASSRQLFRYTPHPISLFYWGVHLVLIFQLWI